MLHTTSGSQFAIFVFLIPYCALFYRGSWRRYAVAAAVVAAVILVNRAQMDSTAYTVSNVGNAIHDLISNGHHATASVSVTNRLHDIKLAFSVLSNPLDAVFGSFSATRYTPMDGQFWVLLYNSGLIGLSAFAIPAAIIYLMTFASAWMRPSPQTVALHAMVTAFGITFLASRVLMYFPFNFVFFMICGLLMRRVCDEEKSAFG